MNSEDMDSNAVAMRAGAQGQLPTGRFSNLAQRVQEAIDEMGQEKMSLNAELIKSRKEVDRLIGEIKAKEKAIKEQKSENTKLQSKITELDGHLDRVLPEKATLVEENEHLKNIVTDMRNVEGEHAERIRQLEGEKNDERRMWTAKCDDLAQQKYKLNVMRRKLEAEVEGRKTVNSRLTSENTSIRNQFEKQIKELKEALEAVEQENAEHKIQEKNLSDQLKATKAIATEVQKKLSGITGMAVNHSRALKNLVGPSSVPNTASSITLSSPHSLSYGSQSAMSNQTSSSSAGSLPSLPSDTTARRRKRDFYQAGIVNTKRGKK